MINKIIDGICTAISAEFGDEYEIYTESVKQGFKEPCFSILCLNPSINQHLGNKYFRQHQFCIHYFPKADEPKADDYDVEERLFNVLELITVDGDLVRGTDIHSNTTDDVLHFFINYDFFVRKENEESDVMSEFEHVTDLK